MDLRFIARLCDSDTFDLADPKYGLIGKYILSSCYNDKYNYNKQVEHIKLIKNIDKLNFKFCISFDHMFYNFINVEDIEYLDIIDSSNIKYFQYAFANCKSLLIVRAYGLVSSNAENISYMFKNCESLTNQGLHNWDTSNITNMTGLCKNCKSLKNLGLNNWDISNVKYMNKMLYNCDSLRNLNLIDWTLSNVEKFENSNVFNNKEVRKQLKIHTQDDYEYIIYK